MRIKTTPEELPGLLHSHHASLRAGIVEGTTAGAHRARGLLARKTPKDTGMAKAAWKVTSGIPSLGILAELHNDAPYVGILEKGARPHSVNKEGWAAIYRWVLRKGLAGKRVRESQRKTKNIRTLGQAFNSIGRIEHNRARERQAAAITWAIVGKIRKEGQRPTYFVRDAMPKVRSYMRSEVRKRLNALFRAPKQKMPGIMRLPFSFREGVRL